MCRPIIRFASPPGLLALALGTLLVHLVWAAHLTWADTITYSYDTQGQLIQAQEFAGGVIRRYAYDAVGNRQQARTYGTVACADRTVCNPDFEDNFTAWSGVDNAALVPGRSGQGAQVSHDSQNSDIQQLLPGIFPSGGTYRATAWCKAAAGSSCRLFLGDSNFVYGAAYEHAITQEWGGNGGWQRISTPPLTLAHDERLNVYIYGDAAGPAIYDDLLIEEVAPVVCPERAICNGNFERGFEYWVSVKNAVLTTGRNGGTGVQVNADGANGDIIQTLPGVFAGGHTYTATAWCKAATGQYCRLYLGDSNLVHGPASENVVQQTLAGTGNWQPLKATLTLSHDEQLQVYLYADGIYDDVQVQENPGLIAAYPFSEGSGSATADASGHGYHGTLLNGATWTAAGKMGNALNFDGVNDYVKIDSGPDFTGLTELTIEAWVKSTRTTGNVYSRIVEIGADYRVDSTTLTLDHATAYPGTIRGWIYAAGERQGGVGTPGVGESGYYNYNDGQWHHVALTYDGSMTRLYVDGSLRDSAAASGTIDSLSQAHLGAMASSPPSNFFEGTLDEIRVYDRALSEEEIQEHASSNNDGLVAAYPFSENYGDVTADASGNGYNGNISDASWTASGKDGNALNFDGVNDYVYVTNGPNINGFTELTIEAWVKSTRTTGNVYSRIVEIGADYRVDSTTLTLDHATAYPGTIRGWIYAAGERQGGVETPGVGESGYYNYNDGQWHHVALTYDGSMTRLYVDGSLRDSAAASGTIDSLSQAHLGAMASSPPSNFFEGTLDEINLYNRALSSTEIQALNASNSGLLKSPEVKVLLPSEILSTETNTLALSEANASDVVSLDGQTVHISVGNAPELNAAIAPPPPPTSAVPEPSTLVLATLGLAGLGLLWRRTRRP